MFVTLFCVYRHIGSWYRCGTISKEPHIYSLSCKVHHRKYYYAVTFGPAEYLTVLSQTCKYYFPMVPNISIRFKYMLRFPLGARVFLNILQISATLRNPLRD
jgi:hypothetical protein